MSKALQVYELGQWIKSDRNIGYVVARMSAAGVWEVREDYKGREEVERFKYRGAGYVVQWIDLDYLGAGAEPSYVYADPVGCRPRRLSWLRAETIAEKRYQPCENPVKAPVVHAEPSVAPSQPALPLDIEAATEATMRAAVALGNQAADWLRAKGLTP